MEAKAALEKLIEGNGRFAAGKPSNKHTSLEWRVQIAKEQKPFATILGCADSRVSPELIFDQGLGDLFIVRVAGNGFGHADALAHVLHDAFPCGDGASGKYPLTVNARGLNKHRAERG